MAIFKKEYSLEKTAALVKKIIKGTAFCRYFSDTCEAWGQD